MSASLIWRQNPTYQGLVTRAARLSEHQPPRLALQRITGGHDIISSIRSYIITIVMVAFVVHVFLRVVLHVSRYCHGHGVTGETEHLRDEDDAKSSKDCLRLALIPRECCNSVLEYQGRRRACDFCAYGPRCDGWVGSYVMDKVSNLICAFPQRIIFVSEPVPLIGCKPQ